MTLETAVTSPATHTHGTDHRIHFDIRGSILRRSIETVAVTALMVALIVALQRRAGSFMAEFFQDQASHYVSGLLIHDYLIGGLRNPGSYLRDFHSHYPMVGIGHWGPVYDTVEAVWMLLFGISRPSMLVLSALITAAIATITFTVVAHRSGRLIGLLVALALVLCPITQEGMTEVMLDAPVTLVCLLSMLAYARYLDSGRSRYAALFGLLAGSGMLIKGNAAALALLPAFTVLIGRRFDLLRTPSFWLPLPIAGALAVPWYWFTYELIAPGFRYTWGWHYVTVAVSNNSAVLLDAVGPLLLAAGIAGFVAVAFAPRNRMADPGTVCAAALFASVWLFQSTVPAAVQDRYLEPALPPILVLAGVMLGRIPDWFRYRVPKFTGALIALFGMIWIVPRAATAEHKLQVGLIEAARQTWANVPANNRVALIIAGAGSEGAAVAELAMHDPARPSLYAIRGTRLLGAGGYNAADYQPRFHTPEQVMAAIDEYRVPLVLFRADESGSDFANITEYGHIQQIAEVRRRYPDRWETLYESDASGAKVALYRIRGNAEQTADPRQLLELGAPHALAR